MALTWAFHRTLEKILSTPKPIGRVHYDEPRAVQVRDPENLDDIHSAIHSGVNVYTDTVSETNYLMDNWAWVMKKADEEVERLLTGFRDAQG